MIKPQTGHFYSMHKGGQSIKVCQGGRNWILHQPSPLNLQEKWLMEIRGKKQEAKDVKSYFPSKTTTRSTDHIRYRHPTHDARYAGRGLYCSPNALDKAIHTAEVRCESSLLAAQCQSRKNPRRLFLQLANATELVVVL